MGAAGKDSGCNSMRVGLIDVDGHNFPNIPLMKLSAWHKQQGDTVEWYEPLFSGHMNRVYMSKVFSFTQDYPYFVDADEVIRGGSGYCIELTDGREHYQKERDKELPPEVEHIYPDYSIYPVKMFKEMTGYNKDRGRVMVYILCNFDTTIEQDIERIQFCRSLEFIPYPMIYDKEHADPIYKKLQRWCNNFVFWKTPRFEDYDASIRR